MSSVTELGRISEELQNEPEDLRTSILSGLAKLKGLDLLTGANAFQRDQARLDAKQRAIYRQQGLQLEDDDDMAIHNILADNITITDGIKDRSASSTTTPAPPQQPPATQQPTPGFSRWLPWLLAGGLTAANAGAGYWLINNLPQPATPADSRATIGLETR